jgi:hypothetical protein
VSRGERGAGVLRGRDADFNHSDLIELKNGVKFMNFIRKFPVKFIPLKMTYDL